MKSGFDIVIATYKRPLLAEKLVWSLRPLCTDEDCIILVCQGDPVPRVEPDHKVILIHCEKANLPSARNVGYTKGKNPFVLFLDDDVVPFPSLLEEHRRCFSEQGVGGVAGGVEDCIFEQCNESPSVFDCTTGELIQNFSVPREGPVISMMGANMAFRRSVLEKIDGFDECYRGNALWEDVDAAFRARAAGFSLWFAPDARVSHLRSSDGGCRQLRGARYVYDQFWNTARFAKKYAPRHHYGSWIRFWKYRLEYISRKKKLFFHHDPLVVCVALCAVTHALLLTGKKSKKWMPHKNIEDYGVLNSVGDA